MPKPPKVAAASYFSATGPILPQFPRGAWDDLEEAIGLKLDPNARKAIRKAIKDYIVEAQFQTNAAKMASLIGRKGKSGKQHAASPLTRLDRAIAEAVDQWQKAVEDDVAGHALISFAALLEAKTHGDVRIDDIREKLEIVHFELGAYLSDLASGSDHADVGGPFRRLVTHIAEIIEGAGGSVIGRDTYAAISRRASESGEKSATIPPSKFQAFMRLLKQCLPPDVQPRAASDAALDTFVRKALSSQKRATARS